MSKNGGRFSFVFTAAPLDDRGSHRQIVFMGFMGYKRAA
jgi:hypothetical protein